MTKSVVAISTESLFRAESKIAGCTNCCSDELTLTFERLLDNVTGLPDTTRYVLPTVAICPKCYNHVVESTMVLMSVQTQEAKTYDSFKQHVSNNAHRNPIQGLINDFLAGLSLLLR